MGLIQVITLRSVTVEFIAAIRQEQETQLNQSAAVMCGFYKQVSAVDKKECFELYYTCNPWAKHFNMIINKMLLNKFYKTINTSCIVSLLPLLRSVSFAHA